LKNKLPDRAESLVQSLQPETGFWVRLTSSFRREEIIEELASFGDPAVIPDLLPLLIIGDKKTILATAEAIHRLISQMEPAHYTHFDESVRQSYSNLLIAWIHPGYTQSPPKSWQRALLMTVSVLRATRCTSRTLIPVETRYLVPLRSE
jgi:HEAT repeat protein